MSEFENRNIVKRSGGSSAGTDWHPRQPFPFEARCDRLTEDFMGPIKQRIAVLPDDAKDLDPAGWTVCRFLYEIARLQAARLARIEMVGEFPKEAPWLWRDLYQLDLSDRTNRVTAGIPRDAMPLFRADGHGWFMAWQYALWAAIGQREALGKRPHDAPQLALFTPDQAFEVLA